MEQTFIIKSIYTNRDYSYPLFNKNIIEYDLPLSEFYYETLIISNNKLSEYKSLLNEYKSILLKMWLCCNSDVYPQFKKIIYDSSKQVSINIMNNDLNDNIFTLISNDNLKIINEIFENWKLKNIDIYKSIIDRGNCVAIAYPSCCRIRNSSNSYYSLSGSSNDYSGGCADIKGWKIESYKEDQYLAVGDLLREIFKFNFIPCHLTDNVRRYVYFDKRKKFNRSTCNGKVLKRFVTFSYDFNKNFQHNDFNAYYSCCEKKIVAKMNFVNNDYYEILKGNTIVNKLTPYIFRIFKEPCRMCRPSLIGCYLIKTINCDNFKMSLIGCFSHIEIGTSNTEPLIVIRNK